MRRKLLGNSVSLLINRLTQSLATFVLIAFIARILGSYELGQYTLAFSYYFIFMTIASQGFKTLFTRELARDPEQTPVYLLSGTLLQLFFSIIGYGMLAIAVFALPYSADTARVCYILGLAIVPFSLSNVTEAIFQAREKMHLIAISTVPIYILRVLVIIWGMGLYGINFVCWILVISEAVILLIEWSLILPFVRLKWQINWDFMGQTIRAVPTFIGIEGAAVLKERMQIFILSLLGGEVVVGLYGAVAQLMQPFFILTYSLVIAVFPRMAKAVTLGVEKQRYIAETLIETLLSVAIPTIIGVFFIGREILVFVYRDTSFTEAAVALNILAIGLIMMAISPPLSFSLVARGFERINLREVIITTVIGGFLSIWLVSEYGLNGAAIAALLMQIIACSQYVYAAYNRLFSLNWWRVIRRPLLISTFMLGTFWILQKLNLNFLQIAVAATLAYGSIVSAIAVYALGGPSIVYAKLSKSSTTKL